MKRKVCFFFFFFFEREREREKEVERKLETVVIINDILGKEGRGEKTGREGKEVPATNISSYFQIETGSWVLKFGPPPTTHHPPPPTTTISSANPKRRGGRGKRRKKERVLHACKEKEQGR